MYSLQLKLPAFKKKELKKKTLFAMADIALQILKRD